MEEPTRKKSKISMFSDHIYSSDIEKIFTDYWHKGIDCKKNNIEIISKPFKICKISNFIREERFMDAVKNELLDIKSRRNSIDLYQFEQSIDLAHIDTRNVKLLYNTFQSDLTTWMEKNTHIELNRNISMSSSCYTDTDFLLCHDDNVGDRRIAFILYLSKSWFADDGGALDLFDTDEHGLPRNVVKSLIPEYNSLIFFEVVENSYHQVAEVTAARKSRWSINGWFHGPLKDFNRPPRPEVPVNYILPSEIEVDLNSWVSDSYIDPETKMEIQLDVERDSFVYLSDFLKADAYEKLSQDLTFDSIVWNKIGPADTCNYEIADEESLPDLLKEFYNSFKSISMFRLLQGYTQLDLVPTNKRMSPKMTIELQRWTNGCYTLLTDRLFASDTSSEKRSDPSIDESSPYSERETSRTAGTAFIEDSVVGPSGCDTPISIKEDDDDDDDMDQAEFMRRILKRKNLRIRKKVPVELSNSDGSSTSRGDTITPPKVTPPRIRRLRDTEDSDVSDIGDYLSDHHENSSERSEPEDLDVEEDSSQRTGSLDVMMQFHSSNIPIGESVDYVDPKEPEGALIHIPSNDNHLCLVYKTVSTCRLHKYINHYCKGYFYNLVCTYYE